MRRFLCPQCGNEIHFNNSLCVQCSSALGYLPSQDAMILLAVNQNGSSAQTGLYIPCGNRQSIGCNWVCESANSKDLCLSCIHTTKIPNIADDENRVRWRRLEGAKRRLFYQLIKLGLLQAQHADSTDKNLHFELLSDEIGKLDEDGKPVRVMTGHSMGKITININEADDAIREKNRVSMGEPYRTLTGHFRHEVAHYYWDKLVANQSALDGFRAHFGDERADYGEALKAHYKNGPKSNWQYSFVSAYASAHPWEDFAETWAHYCHMVSALETAYSHGINPQPLRLGAPRLVQLADPYEVSNFQILWQHWVPLTVAMNAMNRAIGNRDFYPFVLSNPVVEKLQFIHDLIELQ